MSEKFEHMVDVLRHNLRDLGGMLGVFFLHRIHIRFRKKGELFLTTEGDTMEKAYDIQDLLKRYEKIGLPMAEVAARGVLHETIQWFEESAVLSVNKIDDVAALGMPQVEAFLAKQVDKIDEQSGAQ